MLSWACGAQLTLIPYVHSCFFTELRCNRYGGLLVIRGPQELGTGQLTAYILYVIYSVFAITQLVATINTNAAASAAAARVDEILNRRPMATNERGQALTNFRGLVEFKNVRSHDALQCRWRFPPTHAGDHPCPICHLRVCRFTSRTPNSPTDPPSPASPSPYAQEQSLYDSLSIIALGPCVTACCSAS